MRKYLSVRHDIESFQALERKVFNGKALVVVRSLKGKNGSVPDTAQINEIQAY